MAISERNLYHPAFARYRAAVVRGIERIAAAREAVDRARILPAQEDVLRRVAKVGSVHYSNVIEGNELSEFEATRAVDHDLDATTRAKLELVNYVAALDWIEARHGDGAIAYTPEFIRELHGVLTRGLGRPEARFKPHHEGAWRDGEVAVQDAVAVYHVAPPADEVEGRMRDRLEWLEAKRTSTEYFGPILAAIGHFEVAEVHPFADYNGRAARLFAVAVLIREGTMRRRLFSPERYYAENRDAYFDALRAIKVTRNLDAWIEYFVTGLADEFERVAARVRELNDVTGEVESALQLTGHQEKIVAALTAGGHRDLTRAEVEELTGLRKTTAYAELRRLVEAGVLDVRGTGIRTTYSLPPRLRSAPRDGATARRRGPRPTWNDERIRAGLETLARELGRMPRKPDFEAAGKTGLYVAASKAGGLRRWAAELGF